MYTCSLSFRRDYAGPNTRKGDPRTGQRLSSFVFTYGVDAAVGRFHSHDKHIVVCSTGAPSTPGDPEDGGAHKAASADASYAGARRRGLFRWELHEQNG